MIWAILLLGIFQLVSGRKFLYCLRNWKIDLGKSPSFTQDLNREHRRGYHLLLAVCYLFLGGNSSFLCGRDEIRKEMRGFGSLGTVFNMYIYMDPIGISLTFTPKKWTEPVFDLLLVGKSGSYSNKITHLRQIQCVSLAGWSFNRV